MVSQLTHYGPANHVRLGGFYLAVNSSCSSLGWSARHLLALVTASLDELLRKQFGGCFEN